MKRAFVDYYRERGISPVKQDISNIDRHFGRRAALYRFLGIPPLYVERARVLEFGPGSGDNALHTASLAPARYVLVDGNPRAVEETTAQLEATGLPSTAFEVVERYVEDFACAEHFDLVLAEGMIPFQDDPARIAGHVASFVRPGGILVITTADSASAIGEIGRRILANRLIPPSLPYDERRRRLAPVFAPHLATLGGMSRSVDDWIDDNIAHPLTGRLFSIGDAIRLLAPHGFTIYGSSPQFLTDWRWYKQLYGDERQFNERAIERYLRNVANLADYRVTLDEHDAELGARILAATDDLYLLMQAGDRGDEAALAPAIARIRDVASLLRPISAKTAASLDDLWAALAAGDPEAPVGTFAPHFGRGQQYLSFIRAS